MLEMLDKMFGNANPMVYIGLGLVVVVFLVAVIGGLLKMRKGSVAKLTKPSGPAKTQTPQTGETPKANLKLNVPGGIPCMCFRNIHGVQVLDFTTMEKPVGDIYQFDTSLPVSGSSYIVMENEQGGIVDYDPRMVAIVEDELPEHAYDGINWKLDVDAFWTVPLKWWHNQYTWLAAGFMFILFLEMLVVTG